MNEASKKKALVTGGGSGIGLEMARLLAARGYRVAICGRSREKLDRAVGDSPGLLAIRCDVTQERDRAALLAEAEGELGGLDLLVNNAGIVRRFLFSKTTDLEARIT